MAKKFISLENLSKFYEKLLEKLSTKEEVTQGLAGKLDKSATAASATKLETIRQINLTGDATGSANFDGTANADITVTIPQISADKIKGGKLSIDVIPDAAIERLVVVENETAMLLLTKEKVQKGDVVKLTDTGLMYYVKSEDALSVDGEAPATKDDAFEEFKVGTAASIEWSGIKNVPGYVKDYSTELQNKADKTQFEALKTKVESSENGLDTKASKTELSGLEGRIGTVETGLAGKAEKSHTHTHDQITDWNDSVVAVDLTNNTQLKAVRDKLNEHIASVEAGTSVKVDDVTIEYIEGDDAEHKKLAVKAVPQEKVTGLTDALAGKADGSALTSLTKKVTTNETNITNITNGTIKVPKATNADTATTANAVAQSLTITIDTESTVFNGSETKTITIGVATNEEIEAIFTKK